jgi:hypothetical protein
MKKTLDTQFWIMTPQWEGPFLAETSYAASEAEAVAGTREIFTEEVSDLDQIRPATGVELPWNNPAFTLHVVGERIMATGPVEDLQHLYGDRPVRSATPTERETYCRQYRLEEDIRDDEEFNRGFNEAKAEAELRG